MENYGHINPETGLSTRLEDCLKALDQLVDFAIESKVDLVLFCGDAYKSREPTQTQQREFARRISRLSASGIPIFLLTGNHDMPNAAGRATSTEIFATLAVENVYVANRPDVYRIPTQHGAVQVVALPWLRRSALLSKEDTRNLTFEEINQRLQQVLTNIITEFIPGLDPALPAILAAHVWVAGAKVGSESMMTIGQEHVLLLSNVAQPAFDYIALGHIHKRQVLTESPPVVYAGSLERVDFSEESDDKGFYVVEIEDSAGKRHVTFDFHPVAARRFLTVNVTIEPVDPDPTATVLRAIAGQKEKVRDAIVRLQISLTAQSEAGLRDAELREALKEAHYATIARDVKRESRLRLGSLTAEGMTPIDALKTYLETKKVSAECARVLLEYGERLIQEQRSKG